MKLEIDDEVLDNLIVASLTDSINSIELEVKRLKKLKTLKEHQERDLEDCLVHLDALRRTRYYYGGAKYSI